jgi:predicted patatin/cPLA2 family phospholipase
MDDTQKDQMQESDAIVVDSIEVTEVVTDSSPTDQSTVFLSLENLIKSNLTNVDTLQAQYREQKEMVDNVLENDQTYREHLDAANEANKVKSGTKQQVMKRPDVIRIAEKMKALKEEMKEIQATLSDLLQEYQRVSGSNVIEREDGQILEIVSTSKLVRK